MYRFTICSLHKDCHLFSYTYRTSDSVKQHTSMQQRSAKITNIHLNRPVHC